MGVSVTASSTITTGLLRRLLVAVVVIFATLFYLYGPPATPAFNQAAVAKCNQHASANFRSFRLSWEVGVHPHWTCWDAGKPQEPAVSFGWWVNPLS